MRQEEPTPPASVEAEAGIIGSSFGEPVLVAHLNWLTPNMFTHPSYRATWDAMQSLSHDGEPVDMTTVYERMTHMSDHGADDYDRSMGTVGMTHDSSNARHYAAIVLKKYQQRQLMLIANRLAQHAYGDTDPELTAQLSMQAMSKLMALSPDHRTGRKTYSEVLDMLHEDTLRRMEHPDQALRTGFARIDAWTGGLEPGQFILVAARPGAGKSAFGLSLGRRIAGRLHHKGAGAVDIVTMEMGMLSQARRIVAARGEPALDTRAMRQGYRDGDEVDLQAYTEFVRYLELDRAEVGNALAFHEGVITTDQLAVLAMESKTNYGTQVFIIDQLDLFGDTNRNGEYERISTISMKLKQLAMRLQVVIICLVQLNREPEKRSGGDKRPMLSDLRASGRLEQDADMVLGLYRPSYYFPADDDWMEGAIEPYVKWAEMLTLKFRDGQSDIMTPLCFINSAASYTDWDAERWPVKQIAEFVTHREKQG